MEKIPTIPEMRVGRVEECLRLFEEVCERTSHVEGTLLKEFGGIYTGLRWCGRCAHLEVTDDNFPVNEPHRLSGYAWDITVIPVRRYLKWKE
jgi:hypothetical protein